MFEQARTEQQVRGFVTCSALPGMLIWSCGIPLSMVDSRTGAVQHYRPVDITLEPCRSLAAIRQHLTEVLNFQVVWSALVYPLIVLSLFVGITLWPFVWFGGMVMVLFLAYEAGNGGDGRYLVRIPLFK